MKFNGKHYPMVGGKGEVYIPAEFRKRYNLPKGQRFELEVIQNSIVLHPVELSVNRRAYTAPKINSKPVKLQASQTASEPWPAKPFEQGVDPVTNRPMPKCAADVVK